MALHNLGYRHWTGRHCGIWTRRAAISANGLRACLANRWMRYIITSTWCIALFQVALLFSVGQLLVPDSLVVRWSANLDPALQTFVRGFASWLEEHPEISVRTCQNLIFYSCSLLYLNLAILAITLAIPHLITRDLSSNALVIYASKAVDRFDYLLGKMGVLLGLLSLAWLGPLLVAWIFGNLLSPDWSFFWHARLPLLKTLLFTSLGMLFLSLLALAASAVSANEKLAVGFWLILWLVGNALAPAPNQANRWLPHLSFHHNLEEIARSIYQPRAELERARDNIPILGDIIRRHTRQQLADWQASRARPAAVALGLFSLASASFLTHRTRTE